MLLGTEMLNLNLCYKNSDNSDYIANGLTVNGEDSYQELYSKIAKEENLNEALFDLTFEGESLPRSDEKIKNSALHDNDIINICHHPIVNDLRFKDGKFITGQELEDKKNEIEQFFSKSENNDKYLILNVSTLLDDNGGLTLTTDMLPNNIKNIVLIDNGNTKFIRNKFLKDIESLEKIDLSFLKEIEKIENDFLSCYGEPMMDVPPAKTSLVEVKLPFLAKNSSIGDRFLSTCSMLEEVDLYPLHKVKYIGSRFMDTCRSLKKLDLSPLEKVVSVNNAFLALCSNLVDLDFSGMKSLSTISHGCLERCPSIKKVDLSSLEELTNVEKGFCYECSSLREILTKNQDMKDVVLKENSEFLHIKIVTKVIGDVSYMQNIDKIMEEIDKIENCYLEHYRLRGGKLSSSSALPGKGLFKIKLSIEKLLNEEERITFGNYFQVWIKHMMQICNIDGMSNIEHYCDNIKDLPSLEPVFQKESAELISYKMHSMLKDIGVGLYMLDDSSDSDSDVFASAFGKMMLRQLGLMSPMDNLIEKLQDTRVTVKLNASDNEVELAVSDYMALAKSLTNNFTGFPNTFESELGNDILMKLKEEMEVTIDWLESNGFDYNDLNKVSSKEQGHLASKHTPLTYAISEQNHDMFSRLLRYGANINAFNSEYFPVTPLMWVAAWSENLNDLTFVLSPETAKLSCNELEIDKKDEKFNLTALSWSRAKEKYNFYMTLFSLGATCDLDSPGMGELPDISNESYKKSKLAVITPKPIVNSFAATFSSSNKPKNDKSFGGFKKGFLN